MAGARHLSLGPGALLLAVTVAFAQQPGVERNLLPAAPASGLTLVGREPAEHYVASVETWHAGRIARLTGPEGWLALIGRHPLEHGIWTIGSGAENAIRLAAGPANLGTLTYAADGKVTFAVDAYAPAVIDGVARLEPTDGPLGDTASMTKPGEAVTAVLEYQGDKPTHVQAGTINFYIIQSGGKLFVRVRDSESARRKNFAGIQSYPIDPAWRIEADWVPFTPPRTLRITNVLGLVEDSPCPGKAVFQYNDHTYELLPVLETGEERLFFIITDATAGTETYEASRFFYADPPKDGKVVLDFNKVYNPPCAFTPFTVCPLPPKENVLPFPLRAGEKKYSGGH